MRKSAREVVRKLLEDFGKSVITQPVYHGSSVKFKEFKRTPSYRSILFSRFEVNSPAFFFTTSVKDASGFGQYVSEWRIDVRKPFINFPDSTNTGTDFDATIAKEMGYILSPMICKDERGECIDIGVQRYYINDLKKSSERNHDPIENWVYVAIGNEGVSWDVMDNEACVKRMQELGYDGTTVYEPDTYTGFSWAVFKPEQVKFVRFLSQDEVEEGISDENS